MEFQCDNGWVDCSVFKLVLMLMLLLVVYNVTKDYSVQVICIAKYLNMTLTLYLNVSVSCKYVNLII